MKLINYELHRLLTLSPLPIIIIFSSVFIPPILLKHSISLLEAHYIMTLTTASVNYNYIDFFLVFPEVIRPLAILLYSLRVAIYSFSSDCCYRIPPLISVFASFGVVFTTLRGREDVLELSRVGRHRLMLVRGLLSVAFFTLLSMAAIYLARYIYLEKTFIVSPLLPFVYHFSGSMWLTIPTVFLYLLIAQSFAFFILELFGFASLDTARTATFIVFLYLVIDSLVIPNLPSTLSPPPLTLYANVSLINHTIINHMFQGVWCPFIFDPSIIFNYAFTDMTSVSPIYVISPKYLLDYYLRVYVPQFLFVFLYYNPSSALPLLLIPLIPLISAHLLLMVKSL
jgi:hypothetical protein